MSEDKIKEDAKTLADAYNEIYPESPEAQNIKIQGMTTRWQRQEIADLIKAAEKRGAEKLYERSLAYRHDGIKGDYIYAFDLAKILNDWQAWEDEGKK